MFLVDERWLRALGGIVHILLQLVHTYSYNLRTTCKYERSRQSVRHIIIVAVARFNSSIAAVVTYVPAPPCIRLRTNLVFKVKNKTDKTVSKAHKKMQIQFFRYFR